MKKYKCWKHNYIFRFTDFRQTETISTCIYSEFDNSFEYPWYSKTAEKKYLVNLSIFQVGIQTSKLSILGREFWLPQNRYWQQLLTAWQRYWEWSCIRSRLRFVNRVIPLLLRCRSAYIPLKKKITTKKIDK